MKQKENKHTINLEIIPVDKLEEPAIFEYPNSPGFYSRVRENQCQL